MLTIAILSLISLAVLIYMQASRHVWLVSVIVLLVLSSIYLQSGYMVYVWIICLVLCSCCYYSKIRILFLVRPLYRRLQKTLPNISATEKIAIQAGNTGYESEIYNGKVNLDELLSLPHANLTRAEQEFLDGPVEELCSMIDGWEIEQKTFYLPERLLDFIKKHNFFGLMIDKKYKGYGFTPQAHGAVIRKIASVHAGMAVVVCVPNSLGPGELLSMYGTEKQKNYYLPRLACGDEIPCFALTSANAGSDAGSMTDTGTVVRREINGETVTLIRINCCKRYITLAPIATIIGVAFKLYDPEHLLGETEDLGITCALVPTDLEGVTIGARHDPLGSVFPNGPIEMQQVEIRLEDVIGGRNMVGHGWQMLMECLATGRAVSLPAIATGVAKKLSLASSAYARVRRQFGTSLADFGGIQAALADMVGHGFIMQQMQQFSLNRLQHGESSAVAAAICKYHITELGRDSIKHAMDIHAGKGICLGQKNYLSEFYQVAPISITVEGANILTRSMMIFGQGLMRCHPFLLKEIRLLHADKVSSQVLRDFDQVLVQHMTSTASCLVAAVWHGLTQARSVSLPATIDHSLQRHVQQMQRFAAVFRVLSDTLLLLYGGSIKRREALSARMADIHSYLYMMLSIVNSIHHVAQLTDDQRDLSNWSLQSLLYRIQQQTYAVLDNLPLVIGLPLKALFFPLGRRIRLPDDRLTCRVSKLLQGPGPVQDMFAEGCYMQATDLHPAGKMIAALSLMIEVEPLLKTLRKAVKAKKLTALSIEEQADQAVGCGVITKEQKQLILDAQKIRAELIAVDTFEIEK